MTAQPTPKEVAAGVLGLALLVCGWSMAGIFVRWLGDLNPLAVAGWRLTLALTALLPTVLHGARRRRQLVQAWGQASAQVLAARMAGFFTSAVAAFQLAPVAIVTLFLAASPAWVVILRLLSRERVRPRERLGTVLAVTGAATSVLLSRGVTIEGGGDLATGSALAMLAGFLQASYVHGRARVRDADGEAIDSFVLATMTSMWGLLVLLLAFSFAGPDSVVPGTPRGWMANVGLGIFSTAIPLWALASATRTLPALPVALATLFIPLGGSLAAWFLLSEPVPTGFVVGGPIILVGLLWVLGLGARRPS